jgi:hypothetical protein
MSLVTQSYRRAKATFALEAQVPTFAERAMAIDAGDGLEPRFRVRSVHAGAGVMRGEE